MSLLRVAMTAPFPAAMARAIVQALPGSTADERSNDRRVRGCVAPVTGRGENWPTALARGCWSGQCGRQQGGASEPGASDGLPAAARRRAGVVLGGTGQVEQRRQWRADRVPAHAADTLGGTGQVEQRRQRRGVLLAAVAADRFPRRLQEQLHAARRAGLLAAERTTLAAAGRPPLNQQ